MEKYFFRASAEEIDKIPGIPVAYWASKRIVIPFAKAKMVREFAKLAAGMSTGNNPIFQRYWHEVSLDNITFNSNRFSQANNTTWYPCNSGGQFRKWYGNNEILVNWKDNGCKIKNYKGSAVRNTSYYLKPGLTYTKISSGVFGIRKKSQGFLFDDTGRCIFPNEEKHTNILVSFLCSKISNAYLSMLAPSMSFTSQEIGSIPVIITQNNTIDQNTEKLIQAASLDWDSYETSWDFTTLPLTHHDFKKPTLQQSYQVLRIHWQAQTDEMQQLEEENNLIFIEAYSLQDELTPDVPLKEITLTCNPHYRYGGERSDEELETLLQCDTIKELVSYAIGCMMGRYSLDKSGLILASQGETLDDYYRQIPVASFAPDEDGILPLNDQEWFADDATNRVREFVREVWGEDKLRENLDFIAESLCLHAIKAKKGEDSLDCIRRYLSTQFFKDHMRMYKNRPIYWLFSSGKHKAFECLLYLHRYNEGTLARMRTEYLIPLSAKLHSYAEKLEQDKEASTSAAEIKSLEKQITDLHNQQAELAEYDEQLRHYADQRIQLDLDDGVKVNYGKFGTLLAEVKKIAG